MYAISSLIATMNIQFKALEKILKLTTSSKLKFTLHQMMNSNVNKIRIYV